MENMTKKERIDALMELKPTDTMPLFPRNLAQCVYASGYKLNDITSETHLNAERSAIAVLTALERYDYDLTFGTYMDHGFGVPALGGKLHIPDGFGESVTVPVHPVKKREDLLEIKKKLPLDPWKDPRMSGALEAIKIVARAVGDHTPIAAAHFTGLTSACLLLRKVEDLIMDTMEDPDFLEELLQLADGFSMDWIRAQYKAGANSVCYLGEVFGTEMISPKMAKRVIIPHMQPMVDMVKKEFGQKTFLHIHGNMKTEAAFGVLEALVKECGIGGIHLDEKHEPGWIRENIVKRLGIPGAIVVHGTDPLVSGPIDKIEMTTKQTVEAAGEEPGILMAPSCQILPGTPDAHFKAWVSSTHKYGDRRKI